VDAIAIGTPDLRTAATVVAFASSLLLIAGGASKVRRPGAASRALSATNLPSSPLAARTLGVAEVMVGSLFLLAPGRASAILLGGAYVAFAAFLAYLLMARIAVASCGCAGARDLPPSWLHVGLDVAAAAAAIVAALDPPPSIMQVIGSQPLAGVPLVFGLLLIAWLATLVVGYVPLLFGSYERRAVP
jgi:hypothetical protein